MLITLQCTMINLYQPTTPDPPADTTLRTEHAAVREQMERILRSDIFLKSPQLSRFLRYCVEQTLNQHQNALKEQILGTEVFHRDSFDPRLDPIVRVEARRLGPNWTSITRRKARATRPSFHSSAGTTYPNSSVLAGADRLAKNGIPASVLIVEDERIVAKDLENALRGLGYEVIGSVASGEAAILMMEQTRPDIVLMDIVLAGAMRGTEVARRAWSRWRVPVVYLTAFSDAVVLEDIKDSEPYGYLLKPFLPKQVHAVLQIALSRRTRESAPAAQPPAS